MRALEVRDHSWIRHVSFHNEFVFIHQKKHLSVGKTPLVLGVVAACPVCFSWPHCWIPSSVPMSTFLLQPEFFFPVDTVLHIYGHGQQLQAAPLCDCWISHSCAAFHQECATLAPLLWFQTSAELFSGWRVLLRETLLLSVDENSHKPSVRCSVV